VGDWFRGLRTWFSGAGAGRDRASLA
jgi:hypothetical protein